MKYVLQASLLALASYCYGQTSDTLLYFGWNDPLLAPTVSEIGPDGISIGTESTINAGGFNNTTGLAASGDGTKTDIEMPITNDPSLNVAGLDISYAYNRLENEATVLDREDYFRLGNAADNNLNVTFRLDNGDGTFEQITSTNHSFTRDESFEFLRFRYDPNTGEASLTLDGTVLWTYTDPLARPMYWDGAPGFYIGRLMDGSGGTDPTLDELVIREVALTPSEPFPVELLHFRADVEGSTVALNWRTASESGNAYFLVERSPDGSNWTDIERIEGQGTTTEVTDYATTDSDGPAGSRYYRLRQVDFDGTTDYSEAVHVSMAGAAPSVYPNPVIGELHVVAPPSALRLYSASGREINAPLRAAGPDRTTVDCSALLPGIYLLRAGGRTHRFVKR